MKDNRLLLLGDEKSFMVSAMMKELEAAGYKVQAVLPEIMWIRSVENAPKTVLMYLDPDISQDSELLEYIRDQIGDDDSGVRLYLIGTDQEFRNVKNVIPEERISGTFRRPINIKELIEQIDILFESGEATEVRKRILVVDDDGVMLRTIKTWLSEKYQVYMVNSGMNAVKFLTSNKVDLILLDYEMPVLDGPKVLEMLRSEEDTRDIPVMFLTAKSDKDSVMKVLELKPENYLLKTLPKEALLASIYQFFHKQGDS